MNYKKKYIKYKTKYFKLLELIGGTTGFYDIIPPYALKNKPTNISSIKNKPEIKIKDENKLQIEFNLYIKVSENCIYNKDDNTLRYHLHTLQTSIIFQVSANALSFNCIHTFEDIIISYTNIMCIKIICNSNIYYCCFNINNYTIPQYITTFAVPSIFEYSDMYKLNCIMYKNIKYYYTINDTSLQNLDKINSDIDIIVLDNTNLPKIIITISEIKLSNHEIFCNKVNPYLYSGIYKILCKKTDTINNILVKIDFNYN